MSLIPRNQEFFYIVMVSALVIMAALTVVFVHKTRSPQFATSQASEPLNSDMMYQDTNYELDTQETVYPSY